jgi:hypothetical protein
MTPDQVNEASRLLAERGTLKTVRAEVDKRHYNVDDEDLTSTLVWRCAGPTLYFDKKWTLQFIDQRLAHLDGRLAELGVQLPEEKR